MAIFQECKNSKKSNKNTGSKEECIEGLIIRAVLAVPGFTFPSVTGAKTLASWNTAIAEKKIIPLYDVEEFAPANTEDSFYEGRSKKYRTAIGKKTSTFVSILGLCSHNALKSYHQKDMELYEFTEDGAIKAVNTTDGKIKGQKVNLNVGKRTDATADKPANTMVTINYDDYNEFEDDGAVLRPDGWGSADIFGIFDVNIEIVSASATVIKVKVTEGCAGGGETLNTLITTDFIIKDLAGATEAHTFVTADADGVYTLTGTDFATGFTVNLDGVVTSVGLSYEAEEAVAITVV